jgi:nucleoside-diphosphate-sugar epimerase
MKRVLVTGGAGFVGSAVVRNLVAKQKDVAILIRKSSNLRRLDNILPNVQLIKGDLGEINSSFSDIKSFSPDAIVHIAWGGVGGINRNDLNQLDNIKSSFELFSLANTIGCKYFLGVGSQAEYGLSEGIINESQPTTPKSLYGLSKLTTGLMLEKKSLSNGMAFCWLRLFSSYGPDDEPTFMLPYLITQLLQGKMPLLTAGEQIWDYIHVDDVASAVCAALDKKVVGIYNLGSGLGHPLRTVIEKVRDLVNPELKLGFGRIPYTKNQVMHLQADIAALESATGWSPHISLDQGLSSVVDWYKNNH